ncbi:hypothetical protein MRX96_052887 [Rhipicephalus microplus]
MWAAHLVTTGFVLACQRGRKGGQRCKRASSPPVEERKVGGYRGSLFCRKERHCFVRAHARPLRVRAAGGYPAGTTRGNLVASLRAPATIWCLLSRLPETGGIRYTAAGGSPAPLAVYTQAPTSGVHPHGLICARLHMPTAHR